MLICDRVLGAQADRLCNCGWLLPSASQMALKPEYHDQGCNYRRHVTGVGLLTTAVIVRSDRLLTTLEVKTNE